MDNFGFFVYWHFNSLVVFNAKAIHLENSSSNIEPINEEKRVPTFHMGIYLRMNATLLVIYKAVCFDVAQG